MQNLSADDYEYMKQFSASLSCNASLPTTLWCSMEGVRAAYLPYHGTLATWCVCWAHSPTSSTSWSSHTRT